MVLEERRTRTKPVLKEKDLQLKIKQGLLPRAFVVISDDVSFLDISGKKVKYISQAILFDFKQDAIFFARKYQKEFEETLSVLQLEVGGLFSI